MFLSTYDENIYRIAIRQTSLAFFAGSLFLNVSTAYAQDKTNDLERLPGIISEFDVCSGLGYVPQKTFNDLSEDLLSTIRTSQAEITSIQNDLKISQELGGLQRNEITQLEILVSELRSDVEAKETKLSEEVCRSSELVKRLETKLVESQDNQSSALELAKALQAQLSAALAAVAQVEDARALLQVKVDATTKELEVALAQQLLLEDQITALKRPEAQQLIDALSDVASLKKDLASLYSEQATQIAQAETAKASLEENLAAALAAKLAAETDMNKVAAQLKAALAAKLAADQDLAAQLDARKQQKVLLQQAQQTLLDKSQELQNSDAQLLKAERQAAALNQQVTALRKQLAKVSDLLEISEEKDIESQAQLQNLGNRLNAALARAASEQRRRLKLEEAERQRLEAEKLKLEAERDLVASQAEDLAKVNQELEAQVARLENPNNQNLGIAITAFKKQVQYLLNEKNCNAGKVDGLIGKQTLLAANRFARASDFKLKNGNIYDQEFYEFLVSSKSNCKSPNNANSSNLAPNFLKGFRNESLCIMATHGYQGRIRWRTESSGKQYVIEAKARGLKCGTN